MQWYWSRNKRRQRGRFSLLALTGALLAMAGHGQADTNVSGTVLDFITGQPVDGAQVTVSRGGTVLASGTTASGGVFQLFVDVAIRPQPQAINLAVAKAGYASAGQQVIVIAGRADQFSYRFGLLRNEARDCNPSWARTVVVGNVRQPTSMAGDLALSQRIGEVLQYDLLAEVQKTHLAPEQQPVVLPCPEARPRNILESPHWARALKADAFVVGDAEPVDRRFRVDLQITARHGESPQPERVSTQPLNLDRPESADLGRAALAPIMQALLQAYQKDRRFAECVEFATAAQRVLGSSAELQRLRAECQAELPNRGLLSSGGGQ